MNQQQHDLIQRKITEFEEFINSFNEEKQSLSEYVDDEIRDYERRNKEILERIQENNKIKNDIELLRKQYSKGFPLLANVYREYYELLDRRIDAFLRTKIRPATKTADLIRKTNQEKRKAINDQKIAEKIIEYYETLCPFLIETKGEVLDDLTEAQTLKQYSDEENEDRVTWYISKEDYRKLGVSERNQLALDRYWERKKTKKGIGNIYERYVGYLFEKDGYNVEYTGIIKGVEDLGIDLIAKKGEEIIIIQCKYWSEFKTIYENHIFQFFGTTYRYKFDYPQNKIKGMFYTKTKLSELANNFAKDLEIEVVEQHRLKKYPCIKCNISSEGEKIYHLPFDQQYDRTIIEKEKGECFAMTISEAENKGFRRAFKWRGKDNSKSK